MAAVKLVTSDAPARRVCVGCDMLAVPQRPGAPLCKHCTPDAARERIARRADAATNILAAASRRYGDLLAALTPDERDRWHKFDRARKRKADGSPLSPAVAARLHVAADLLRGSGPTDDPMGTSALRALFAADEAHWWAGQEHAAHTRRAQEKRAVLDAWLAAQTQEAA